MTPAESVGRSPRKGAAKALRVEPGEVVVLSPESDRFRELFRRVRPQSANELRELIGLSEEMTKVIQSQGFCCRADDAPASVPAPQDLQADDETVRGRAHEVVARALLTYLRTPNPALLTPMLPTMDRYLELTGFEANLVAPPETALQPSGNVANVTF